MKAIKFLNFTDRDFSWKYDGILYTFPAGRDTYMEDFKAEHFARHLIDRELDLKHILTNNAIERKKLEILCLPGDPEVTKEEAVNIEAKKEEAIRVEIKKNKGKTKKVEKEEEFADLN